MRYSERMTPRQIVTGNIRARLAWLGIKVETLQLAMGHDSITTTARYLRADDPEVRTGMAGVPSYGTRRLRAVDDQTG